MSECVFINAQQKKRQIKRVGHEAFVRMRASGRTAKKNECVLCVTKQAGKMIESVLVVNACICKGKHLFVYRKGEKERKNIR